MARISDREVEKVKMGISLVALLEQQGFELKKQGKDYATCCPFHDDKTPSLIITPDKNLYNCFGCGAAGSVIDWMMQIEKVGFRKAVDLLRESSLPSLAAKDVGAAPKPEIKNPLSETESQALKMKVVNHYHACLLENVTVQAYLKKRGLDHPELINTFKLGFSDRSLGKLLSPRHLQQGKDERESLKKNGLCLESGMERFSGSLVVPVINKGKVFEIYGRKVGNKLNKDAARHLYLPGKHEGIWNLEGIQNQTEIILCESLIDAMTLWANGFKNVTTSYGVNGFTEELHDFIRNNIKTVFIAYDRDEGGNKAAHALIEKFTVDNVKALQLGFPPEMDINEWAQAYQESEESFADMFNECLLSARASTPYFLAADSSLVAQKVEEALVTSRVLGVARENDDLHIDLGQRHYRVRGLEKNKHREQLKINLMLRHGDNFFIDALDLYQSKQRQQFIKQAVVECGVDEGILKADLGKLLLTLEHEQENHLKAGAKEKPVELSKDETDSALLLLKDPDLLNRIVNDFGLCGVVGEATNALVGYLAATSRKLEKPLAVMIQSTSAAGKSSLMDAVLNFMPSEERMQYSAMTGQALYYLGETNLKHKILAIAEEEGASNASYALKLLQSEGEITIASTSKDESSGDLQTKEYTVEGPVMLFLTTTAIDVDEELLNRCLVITVNESQPQTNAIHDQQRFNDTIEGLLAKEHKQDVLTCHHNAQRLLKSVHVVNPFAKQLTFLSHQTRSRRDHQKYLTLIKSVTLLHQYQREMKTITHNEKVIEYIEVALSDIEIANELAHEVLGRTLDELPPQTRTLLTRIQTMVGEACKADNVEQTTYRFSRRDVRVYTGWGETQVRVHMQRLVDMEYVLTHRGSRGHSYEYELLFDDAQGMDAPHVNGLLDVSVLRKQSSPMHTSMNGSRGNGDMFAGSSRPQRGAIAAGSHSDKNGSQPKCDKTLELFEKANAKKRIIGKEKMNKMPFTCWRNKTE